MKRGPRYGRDPFLAKQQIAELLGVSGTTAVRIMNAGSFEVHRTIGGRRRARRSDVVAYARSIGMPVETSVDDGRKRLVWIDRDARLLLDVANRLRPLRDKVDAALLEEPVNGFVEIGLMRPDLVLLDAGHPAVDAVWAARAVNRAVGHHGADVRLVVDDVPSSRSGVARDALRPTSSVETLVDLLGLEEEEDAVG